MNVRSQLRLYLITDDTGRSAPQLAGIVDTAVAGGVTAVQFRELSLPAAAMHESCMRIWRICRDRGVPLILNANCLRAMGDRLRPKLPTGCGVQFGARTVPAVLPTGTICGYSAHEIGEADDAVTRGASFVTLSPIYPTPSKPGVAARGLEFLSDVRRVLGDAVIVGLGGICAANAGQVVASGADGVAVIRSIIDAADPEAAAKNLRAAVDAELSRQGRRA